MKKFLALLSILTVIFAGYSNNLFAQDNNTSLADDGTILITEQDEEYCPFCNAIAAAQANNLGCIIVVQSPDGSAQMTTCPAPNGKDCATPAKKCKPCKTCPKCKTAMPKLDPKPSQAEIVNDKALKQ